MNDEHREATSGSGPSAHSDSTTATADLVDRRWFEDALRAQGFLVEAPDEVIDPPTEIVAAAEASAKSVQAPADPESVAFEWLGPEPEAESEPEPAAATVEPDWESSPIAGAEPVLTAEPASEPMAEAEVVQDRTQAAPPEANARPWHAAAPASIPVPATPTTTWPVIGQMPTRVSASPTVVAGPAVAASTRQPVAPTTLAGQVPPVPTAALAARLSRGSVTSSVKAPVPIDTPAALVAPSETGVAPVDAVPGLPVEPDSGASSWIESKAEVESLEIATEAEPVRAPVPWDVPAPDAGLDPLLPSDQSTTTLEDAAPAGIALGLATAAIGMPSPEVLDASSAEVTARAEADLQTRSDAPTAIGAPEVVEASDPTSPSTTSSTVDTSAPVEAAVIAASAVAADPSTPFAPPTSGIAAVAPRPPGATVGTTVDDGESDLWGLVGDPRKAAAPAGAAVAETRTSRLTTIVLTIIVAFVVVALVLGFLYLLTDLL